MIGNDKKKKKKKKKKRRTYRIVNFAVSADHRAKLKENEKRDKYLEITRELKNNNYGTWRWPWYLL